MPFKRHGEPQSIDAEREALREQHAALEELKRELADRIDAVREREQELQHALDRARKDGAGRASTPAATIRDTKADTGAETAAAKQLERELADRERAVTTREQRLAEQERDLAARATAGPIHTPQPPVEPDAERLAQIETRLSELREVEKIFLRTRDELAARSEAVAARERLVAQKERELDDREDGKSGAAELSELEARLRRLEQQGPGEQTLGFSRGLRKLEQERRERRGD